MMKYKAVIFDLFGTLIKNYPLAESHAVLRRMAMELSIPAESFIEKWDEAFPDRMTGVLRNFQHCIESVCKKMGVPVTDETIELAANIRLQLNIYETAPRDEALEVLSNLKKSGLKTGLLSDCSSETVLLWKDFPIAPLIDSPVFSCVEGTKKPDPRLYRKAAENLGVSQEKCIYVGDGIGQELHGAAGTGMFAVQILVPGEDDYDRYRGDWNGPVITSLREVLNLVE